MATYTSWQDLLDDITTKINKVKGVSRFSKCRTFEERIEFCMKDDYIMNKCLKFLKVMCSAKHRKYWEKAAELRVEGNSCFQKGHYEKALEFYTKSILVAPSDSGSSSRSSSGNELSLAYGNRSAALFFLQKYQACLGDVHRAFENHYPKDLHYKLFFRKAQCLVKLGSKASALKALAKASTCITGTKIDSKKAERYFREIEDMKSILSQMEERSSEIEKKEDYVPALSHGCQSTLTFASAGVDMKYLKEKGRYVVANRGIKAGDTLFVERPYSSVLLPAHYLHHCHHCYVRLEAPLPCHNCSQVRYCSTACSKESWKRYHHFECGNLNLLHAVGIAHLAFRVIVVSRLHNLLDFYSRAVDPSSLESIPYDNSYCNVYNLVTHADDMHVEDAFQYTLTALLLLLLLERMGFFIERDGSKDDANHSPAHYSSSRNQSPARHNVNIGSGVIALTSDDTIVRSDVSRPESIPVYIGGLLLRHIYQLVCNAHAITALQTGPCDSSGVSTQRQVRVSTAIYPTASLMNHSCDPTIISSFYKDILIVRAIKDVTSGGEIFNCYGPHYKRMSKEERQKNLKEQYFFTCICEACSNEEDREMRFQGLKCLFCEGPLSLPDPSNRSTCLDCNTEQECAAQLQRAFTAHDLFVQGLQLAAKGNFRDALEKLHRCLKMREKVMYRLHRQLAEVQDQIARCYAALSEYCLSVEYLRPTLTSTEAIYGANSIEVANELQKFSDILVNAVMQLTRESFSLRALAEINELSEESMKVLDRAEKIFHIHYGPQHEALKELKTKRAQVQSLQSEQKKVGNSSATTSQTKLTM